MLDRFVFAFELKPLGDALAIKPTIGEFNLMLSLLHSPGGDPQRRAGRALLAFFLGADTWLGVVDYHVGVVAMDGAELAPVAGLAGVLLAHDARHGRPFFSPSACQASGDRKSTRLNSSHVAISYAVFCLKKKKK